MSDNLSDSKVCIECGKAATRQPQLLIWAQGQKKKHPPAIGAVGVLLCDKCKLDSGIESTVMDVFRDVAKAAHMPPPGYWEVQYIPIGDPKYWQHEPKKK